MKGGLYLNTRSFFQKNAETGVESLREVLGPGPLRDFIDQHFLTGGWYEVMNVPQLIAAEAAAMKMSERRYLRHRTEWQAEADMGGAYKILLKVASPDVVVPRLPKVMTQMFNFAAPTVEPMGRNAFHMRVDGVPADLGAWLTTDCAATKARLSACAWHMTKKPRLRRSAFASGSTAPSSISRSASAASGQNVRPRPVKPRSSARSASGSGCAEADAWATALMVMGCDAGSAAARQHGLDALFLTRGADGTVTATAAGRLFAA